VCGVRLAKDYGGKYNKQFHKFLPLALIEHGLAEDGVSAQYAILLELVETSKQSAA
jgi:hypothetical protein